MTTVRLLIIAGSLPLENAFNTPPPFALTLHVTLIWLKLAARTNVLVCVCRCGLDFHLSPGHIFVLYCIDDCAHNPIL